MKLKKEIIYSQHLGIHAINPFAIYNSSPRNVMCSSHLGQRLVIEGADEEIVQTGVSREYGKYTFAVRMPADGTIINIIQKYPQSVSKNTLPFNPETIVIYENHETKEIDYISIPYHNTLHQYFGYKYNLNDDAISLIKHGGNIPKGTVFADSPSIAENGGYKIGINANTAFMSHPSVAEDGIAVSKSFAQKLKFRVYDTRVVEFGSNNFPLNLYGDLDNYKPFPEIGDYIRDDGILMMLRDYDLDTVPVNFHPYSTMEPDMMFDAATYVRGAGGRIVDIEVISNNNINKNLPEQMRGQINRYSKAYLRFCQEIINTDLKIRQNRKKSYGSNTVKLSHRLHRLITDCLAVVNYNEHKYDQKLLLQYKKTTLDEFRIKFVIETTVIPDLGYKLSDYQGGKGVICSIIPDEDMPVDEHGNRADVIVDDASPINRSNLGRLYYQYFASASREVQYNIRSKLNIGKKKITFEELATYDVNILNECYNYILALYKIVNEEQYEYYRTVLTDEEKLEHIVYVLNNEVYLRFPIDTKRLAPEVVMELERIIKPLRAPVTYRDQFGNHVKTVKNIRIAPVYMMLLEKTPEEYSSVSSGKLQITGILASLNKTDRYRSPYRNTPAKFVGETENRILTSYCDPVVVAEIFDRSNSPITQEHLVKSILNSDKPFCEENLVDRNVIGYGGSKSLQLVNHMLESAGTKLEYVPEDNI